jgi:hypothetical protein
MKIETFTVTYLEAPGRPVGGRGEAAQREVAEI